MAVTFTHTVSTFEGYRCSYGNLTLDGVTSGTVATGLENIQGGWACPKSCNTTLGQRVEFNRGSAGTAIDGYVCVSAGTDGDTFTAFFFGR